MSTRKRIIVLGFIVKKRIQQKESKQKMIHYFTKTEFNIPVFASIEIDFVLRGK